MKVRNNITNRNYLIVGFENGNEFRVKYSLEELLSNSSDDTELLYTIQDNYINSIIDLKVRETIYIESSRDNSFGCGCVVCRLS